MFRVPTLHLLDFGKYPPPLAETTKKSLQFLFKFGISIHDSFLVIYDYIFEGNLNAVGVVHVWTKKLK